MKDKKQKIIFIILAAVIFIIALADLIWNISPGRGTNKKENETTTIVGEMETTEEETTLEESKETSQKETETTASEEKTTEAKTTAASEETEVDSEENTTAVATEAPTAAPTVAPTAAPTEAQTVAPTAAPETKPAVTSEKVKYKVSLEKGNSWENNGLVYTQYACKVTNTSGTAINTWKSSFKIGTGYKIDSSWNGTIAIKDGVLTITPGEWNGNVAGNTTIEACGFIIAGPKSFENMTYDGEGTVTIVPEQPTEAQKPTATGNDNPPKEETPYTPPKLESGTPFANHGALSVSGTNLVDSKGQKYQLKGVSTHGLQWFPQYVNKETFKDLRDNWGANLIRLACYSAEGGYTSDATSMEKTIDTGVQAATELGMYVIIDWHILSDGDPNANIIYAKTFFTKMASKYSKYNNVLYEICNEPNGIDGSWTNIKSYAEKIIPIIRKYAPNAIIICGTPTWSQDVDQVALNPLKEACRKNVMYTAHFYAATHKDDLRNKVKNAIAAGTPIFITEFSICDASGNGAIDYTSANEWKSLMNTYNLSYAGWSLCNKGETSALISSGVSKLSGFTTNDLSDAGKWLRNMIAGK